jgi:hypothetical protein
MIFTRDQFKRIKESESYKNSIFKNLDYEEFNKLLDEHKIEELVYKIAREINKLNNKLPSDGLNISIYSIILKIDISKNKEKLKQCFKLKNIPLKIDDKIIGIISELEEIIRDNFVIDRIEKFYINNCTEKEKKYDKSKNDEEIENIVAEIRKLLYSYKETNNKYYAKEAVKKISDYTCLGIFDRLF